MKRALDEHLLRAATEAARTVSRRLTEAAAGAGAGPPPPPHPMPALAALGPTEVAATAEAFLGRAVQVDPIKSKLKATGTVRLKLTHANLRSNLLSNSTCAATPWAAVHSGGRLQRGERGGELGGS